jgi:hypothetical protein
LEVAYWGAARLDHGNLMSMAAANLAICQYRLGSEKELLRWATVAWEKSRDVLKGEYGWVQTAYYFSLAGMTTGQPELTRVGLERLRTSAKLARTPWTLQAALLLEADLVWLLGDKRHAMRIIAEVWKAWTTPLAPGWEGPFTRWCTLYLVRERRFAEVEELLGSMEPRLSHLDALDRAEVLCSQLHLDSSLGKNGTELASRVQGALDKLPLACTSQLERLGLLRPN